MYLGYKTLTEIFTNTLGIRDPELQFYTVSAIGTVQQPRGLFIPLFNNEDALMDAINNGAVAAIWKEDLPPPAFTPNLFPIFKTKNMKEDVKKMFELYLEGIKKEVNISEVTQILISGGKPLSEINERNTHLAELLNLVEDIEAVRRG
jgi:UDP-N-acetylmuramyl pentapeptide synthase